MRGALPGLWVGPWSNTQHPEDRTDTRGKGHSGGTPRLWGRRALDRVKAQAHATQCGLWPPETGAPCWALWRHTHWPQTDTLTSQSSPGLSSSTWVLGTGVGGICCTRKHGRTLRVKRMRGGLGAGRDPAGHTAHHTGGAGPSVASPPSIWKNTNSARSSGVVQGSRPCPPSPGSFISSGEFRRQTWVTVTRQPRRVCRVLKGVQGRVP